MSPACRRRSRGGCGGVCWSREDHYSTTTCGWGRLNRPRGEGVLTLQTPTAQLEARTPDFPTSAVCNAIASIDDCHHVLRSSVSRISRSCTLFRDLFASLVPLGRIRRNRHCRPATSTMRAPRIVTFACCMGAVLSHSTRHTTGCEWSIQADSVAGAVFSKIAVGPICADCRLAVPISSPPPSHCREELIFPFRQPLSPRASAH
jgi:hypothetical protein